MNRASIRASILAEIRTLERQKANNPDASAALNEQITQLCDQLKSLRDFAPRKGIV